MLNQVSDGQNRALVRLLRRSRWRLRLSRRWENQMPGLLRQIGETLQISRSYLFQNFCDTRPAELCARQRFEWTAPGVRPEIDNPALQAASYQDIGCAHWIDPLRTGLPICEELADAPEATAALMRAQGILALLVVPVIAGEHWWGFLGVDDCAQQRQWRNTERDLLMGVANQIGSLLDRRGETT